METISLEDIRESNRIKVETCKSCIEDLKGIFSNKQLQKSPIAISKEYYSEE